MAVLRFHQGHRDNPGQSSESSAVQRKPGRWNEPDTFGLASAIFMLSVSVVALAGFAWAESADAALVGTLCIVVGAPFLVFGAMIALVVLAETLWHRFWRVRRHCGRCRFYMATEGQYTLGRCFIDPRDSVVHRLDSCSYFSYSERAMVRDRFAQQADTLIQVRKRVVSETRDDLHGSGEQPPSDI
jgi:hypothetical protein